AYPVPAEMNLKGLLSANINTAFDMASIEKEQYENTATTGTMGLSGFEYTSKDFANPIKLSDLAVTFNPKTVTLQKLNGTTGKTDFSAKGTIDNLLGYMFNDEKVRGNFDLSSNTFALNDFMVAETEEPSEDKKEKSDESEAPKTEEKIKIPSFLDVTINAAANTVLYDNLTLKDVKGTLRIKDETATLSNMTSSIFDGKMAFNGKVSTKEDTPNFDMQLDMSQLQIGETFKSLDLLKSLAPIAQVLQGKLNSDISLSGNLTDDLLPDLMTLSGNILANIMTEKVDTEKAPLLSALDSKLNFIDLDQLNLKDLKTKMSFENGLVSVEPFTLNYKDIAINVGGTHTFDKKLNYKATMDVPAKYLGGEVNKLLSQIGEDDLENLTIPVVANIGGNYTSPNVTTDLASGMKSLTGKLVEIQKQKLVNKGKDKVKDLIGDAMGNKGSDENGAKKQDAKEILGDLLGNKKKDSVPAKTEEQQTPKKEDEVKEKAKNILGGLLGGKKKDSTN
ncbi:MAG: AsmA-like C-terminal region-containing protein, partial [Pricia sp.]